MYITDYCRFCTYDAQVCKLEKGVAKPDSVLIKKFLKWWACSSTGRLQQAVNLTSAKTTWARLQATIFRITDTRLERHVNEDILAVSIQDAILRLVLTRQWINTELVDEGLVVRGKGEKRYSDSVVYRNLVRQLWCLDADEFKWERDRVQMALMLQIHFFSAARPGAIVSTGYYPDLCLTYNDVLFALVRGKDGGEKFTIVLTQRWRKARRKRSPRSK